MLPSIVRSKIRWYSDWVITDSIVTSNFPIVPSVMISSSINSTATPFFEFFGQLEERTSTASESFTEILNGAYQELKEVDSRMDQIDEQFTLLSASDEKVKRLMQIPGYEPVVSSAFVSALGDGPQLKRWRVASVWLGAGAEAFR